MAGVFVTCAYLPHVADVLTRISYISKAITVRHFRCGRPVTLSKIDMSSLGCWGLGFLRPSSVGQFRGEKGTGFAFVGEAEKEQQPKLKNEQQICNSTASPIQFVVR